MNPTIVLFGAAGKIGTRISNNLCNDPDLNMLYVEAGEAGQARLHQRGLTPADGDAAVAAADVIILAIPDTLIGKVAAAIVPTAKSGAMIICLDPAAPYGGELPAARTSPTSSLTPATRLLSTMRRMRRRAWISSAARRSSTSCWL